MAIAKRRAIDMFRRTERFDRKLEELGHDQAQQEPAMPDFDAALDEDIGDDLLRLVFTACHPVLATEARVALTPPPCGTVVPECVRARRGVR